MTRIARLFSLALVLAFVSLVPARRASAQIPVTDAAALQQRILNLLKQIEQYRLQLLQYESQVNELRHVSTAFFGLPFAGSWLHNQLFSCPWSHDYVNSMNFPWVGDMAYINSTLRTLENGCLVDSWPEVLQAQERLRKKYDMANTNGLRALAVSSQDLRHEDETIGAAIELAASDSETDRTTTVLLQKTAVNTATALAIQRRIQVTEDAILEALVTQNTLQREQLADRLNTATRQDAAWDRVLRALR